jgi:hypothetical protein
MRLSAIIVLLLLQVAARADEPRKTEARGHFKHGVELIRHGEYDKALAEFQEAYHLFPNERLHYDIAQAYRLKGDRQSAIEHYRAYLAAVAKGETADDARLQLAVLGATLGFAAGTPSPPSEPSGEPAQARVGAPSPPSEPSVEPAQARAIAPPPPAVTTPAPVILSAAPLAITRLEAAKEASRRSEQLRLGGVAAMLAGAGIAGVAIYFNVDGANAQATLARELKQNSGWLTNPEQATDARGRRDNIAAGVSWGVGAAALLAGTAMVAVAVKRGRTLRLSALVGRGTMVSCAGAF